MNITHYFCQVKDAPHGNKAREKGERKATSMLARSGASTVQEDRLYDGDVESQDVVHRDPVQTRARDEMRAKEISTEYSAEIDKLDLMLRIQQVIYL